MNTSIILLNCLTNMHVGAENVNYSVIDNQVERDSILQTPIIFSSGVKGALRYHFENNMNNKVEDVQKIFGYTEEKGEVRSYPGCYKFMDAQMIARPMRVSKGELSYVKTTSVDLLNYLRRLLINLDITMINNKSVPKEDFRMITKDKVLFVGQSQCEQIEGIEVEKYNVDLEEQKQWVEFLEIFLGEQYAIMNTEDFLLQDLPVVSRNKLDEKGQSENLWYEEIVPHESVFYFIAISYDNVEEKVEKTFKKIHGEIIQFGGNASIGQGYTKANLIYPPETVSNGGSNE